VEVLGKCRVRVLAGESTDARGAALRAGAKGVNDAKAGAREPIEVRRADPTIAVASEVPPAEIIGHEDQHVRVLDRPLRAQLLR
jgi:hypothetical protein